MLTEVDGCQRIGLLADAISDAISNAGAQVSAAIRKAAQQTGASFDYLLKTALRESDFDPNAKATTSSATGLFQFVDQTWLATLKQAGPSLGYGQYANAIVESPSGHYSVPDPNARHAIMNLRLDPTANAALAGALTQSNAAELRAGIGRAPTEGELYIAHVLGAAGAVKLIDATATTPRANAAALFPGAARANPSIFYGGNGVPRTVSEVYATLTSRHGNASVEVASTNAVLAPTAATAIAAAASQPVPQTAIPDVAASGAAAFGPRTPHFRSLFQTEGRGAVSPVVSQLWGSEPVTPNTASTDPAGPASSPGSDAGTSQDSGAPLTLFKFLRPELQKAATSG
jgi:hypothetical protein